MKRTPERASMIQQLKVRLTDYSNSLTIYDYTAFGWLFVMLFVFIILSFLLIKSKPKLSTFFMFVILLLFITGPIGIKFVLDKTVRKVAILDQNHTQLNFSKYLVVTGKLENRGKVNFGRCYINAKIQKISDNKYKNILNLIKPLRKRTIMVDKNISVNESEEFKVVFEKFDYRSNYDVVVSAECY